MRLRNECAGYFFDEQEAYEFKGEWNKRVFKVDENTPLDLEIGTGNGFFFAHHTFQNPDRRLIGIEIKYRCLYQTLRRMQSMDCTNGVGVRVHAAEVEKMFSAGELDNVYIFFPDPWPKRKHHKNRLIQLDFLRAVYDIQKPGSFFEFKTDNPEYFEWTLERLKKSPYKIERLTYDLHNSEWSGENFQTHFEKLWTSKGLKTMLVRGYKI